MHTRSGNGTNKHSDTVSVGCSFVLGTNKQHVESVRVKVVWIEYAVMTNSQQRRYATNTPILTIG